jgi:hypothetical protein
MNCLLNLRVGLQSYLEVQYNKYKYKSVLLNNSSVKMKLFYFIVFLRLCIAELGNIHNTFQNGGNRGVVQNSGGHGTLQNGGNNHYRPFQGVVNHGTSGYNSGLGPPPFAAAAAVFPDLQNSPVEITKQKPSDKFKDYD